MGVPIVYVDRGHLVKLRARMGEYDASLWIEQAWTPKLQREGDASLMEAFVKIPGVTRRKLQLANIARIWIGVVTIADLANASGDCIPDGNVTGNWRAGSGLEWPNQDEPPR